MRLTKEQIEELKKERDKLIDQRGQLQQQAQDQLTAMGGAISYIEQTIQMNEKTDEEEKIKDV